MSRRPLPLNAVYAFIVVARHLNLTHAARELCITQGAVSRKVAMLENWLGFALFDRHARGLRLTAQGAALLPAVRAGYEQMTQAADQASRTHAVIRLKAPTCAMRWLVPKLVALEQARPDLHVSLTTTLDHHSRLENYDAAILYGPPLTGSYRLFDEALTPVLAAELAPEGGLEIEALERFTFLHPTADNRDWLLWLNQQRRQVTMRRNQHFDTMDLAIGAAVQGFGVTVADVTLIESDLAMKRLVAPFGATVKTGAVWSLVQRPANEAPAQLQELVAWLCQYAQKETQSSGDAFDLAAPGSGSD
ncbi:LysR substrate-binding domain-containing protein [Erwinia mallotivora]|uniref:LysR family transcriptional regulator n=1 Tax=Erwinia mallotivora TaxID=69222 RepID=A0A014NSU9_9GAMM|nr:LysR substrate-binding domain-containing protein [Erwinia mallotivora]EXU76940.1 LysR family transcriptional regulator [Erwinia mallotivora]